MPVFVDISRCIACHACQVACSRTHLGKGNISLQIVGGRAALPLLCRQCEDAPCVAACYREALAQKGSAVEFDKGRCTGCGLCAIACPFGVVWSDTLAYKCDMCSGKPACVETCPAGALFGDYEEAVSKIRSRAARSLQGAIL